MTKDEALKLAQKALSNKNAPAKTIYEALAAIQKALAQPEQEPVAKVVDWGIEGPRLQGLTNDWPRVGTLLYTTPPQSKPLTDEDVNKLVDDEDWYNDPHGFVKAIEAKLKENNT